MKTMELIGYSRRKIKGRRREVLLMCLPPICAEMFFRLAEATVYSLMLYFGAFSPAGLFTGESIEQLVVAVVFTFIRWIISAPLWCAAAVRLMEFAGDTDKKSSFSELLLNWRFIRRSLSAFFMQKIICTVTLAPSVIAGIYTIRLISSDADSTQLFWASNTGCICILLLLFWISLKISIMSVPFLLAEYPQKSGAGTVFMSFRFMRGRRRLFVGAGAVFFIPFLTVIAIPFIIPEIASVCATGISIFFKEDEYARTVRPERIRKRLFAKKIRQRGET
ncbi:MAG: hypothetical protein NC340_01280 [Ruminococcus flavefaciens]|nr:hypothetical protein [Ruminococcus flavefaciens]MCM1228778.1 hypothetical protein [Ruminococcus flavefaciens]